MHEEEAEDRSKHQMNKGPSAGYTMRARRSWAKHKA